MYHAQSRLVLTVGRIKFYQHDLLDEICKNQMNTNYSSIGYSLIGLYYLQTFIENM